MVRADFSASISHAAPGPDKPKAEPPPKPKGLVVHVKRDADEFYVASWGSNYKTVPVRSMSTALRWLANMLDAARIHGADKDLLENYKVHPDRLCQYCYAPIFFAHHPYPSEKWLPFDVEPVEAEEVEGERVATFSHNVGEGDRLTIVWTKQKSGFVYVPHPATCGYQTTAPENAKFAEKWAKSHQAGVEKKDRAIQRLQELMRNHGQTESDHS